MMMMLKIFFVLTTIVNTSFGSNDVRENRNLKSKKLDENVELQRIWHEWNFCTNAEFFWYFTPMTEIVPKNVLLLTTKGDCTDQFQTRTATIPHGKETIFMRIWTGGQFDITDNWELGLCVNTPEEAEQFRQVTANLQIADMQSSAFQSSLLLKVDGVDVTPIFVNDPGPYNLTGCSDGRTSEEFFSYNFNTLLGDQCDTDPYQPFNGMDAYPLYGWWGKDTRTWKKGESHTFEFGIPDRCYTARYVITAE